MLNIDIQAMIKEESDKLNEEKFSLTKEERLFPNHVDNIRASVVNLNSLNYNLGYQRGVVSVLDKFAKMQEKEGTQIRFGELESVFFSADWLKKNNVVSIIDDLHRLYENLSKAAHTDWGPAAHDAKLISEAHRILLEVYYHITK